MSTETKFIVGEQYFYRFACDSDTFSYMTVVSRTDKTAVISQHGKTSRRKIHNYDGVESISAGNYSMAGLWRADRSVVSETAQEPETVETVVPSNVVAFPSKAVTVAKEAVDPLESKIMEAMGRKILMEALEAQGRKDEVAMISAILDRDHWKLLETLRGIASGIRAGG